MQDSSRVLTVTQLNDYVKMLLDGDPRLCRVSVRGEISNFTHHSSGHLYFSVKDENARVMAVMFRSDAAHLAFRPENGMKVMLSGRLSVYQRDGVYQLYVSSMEPDGIGALYLQYEQLKAKLEREGLFSTSLKKPLPKIPLRVGLITSPTGAALRDMIQVTGRRFPMAEIVLYPALVQGDLAEGDLIDGIRYFSETRRADVVIIGRGGGSIEDLWSFNSERLAREIRLSHVPVISAVGHETDFTICDFAADCRAPTPSAAAELAVPDVHELKTKFDHVTVRMHMLLHARIDKERAKLKRLVEHRAFAGPRVYIDDRRLGLLRTAQDLENAVSRIYEKKRSDYERQTAVLQATSPLRVIAKGYSAVFDDHQTLIQSVRQVSPGSSVSFRLSDGTVDASVTAVRPLDLIDE